jgi:hypothetical protein
MTPVALAGNPGVDPCPPQTLDVIYDTHVNQDGLALTLQPDEGVRH